MIEKVDTSKVIVESQDVYLKCDRCGREIGHWPDYNKLSDSDRKYTDQEIENKQKLYTVELNSYYLNKGDIKSQTNYSCVLCYECFDKVRQATMEEVSAQDIYKPLLSSEIICKATRWNWLGRLCVKIIRKIFDKDYR